MRGTPMLVHLGQDFIVNGPGTSSACFDLDTATDRAGQKEKITDAFLRRAQREGAVVDVSGAMPQSFVGHRFRGRRRVHHAAVHPPRSSAGRKGLRFSHAAPVLFKKKSRLFRPAARLPYNAAKPF